MCSRGRRLIAKSAAARPRPPPPPARDSLLNGTLIGAALKNLSGSLDHGLLTKPEQSTARKYLAFIHCVSNREAANRSAGLRVSS